ncbi:MAG: PH domain-containing protein [Colwellia sp.]
MMNDAEHITEKPLTEKNTEELAEKQDTQTWQRVSPIAILYFTVKVFSQLFSNIIYLTPVILVSYQKVLANPHLWLPVIATTIAFIVALTSLKFYFFQYRLSNGHIEIRSGVLSKKNINLPFDRIQNVKLEQPLYYRPFSYACLELDTAGSSKQEAKIVALKVDFAEQLKSEILASHNQAKLSTQDAIKGSPARPSSESAPLKTEGDINYSSQKALQGTLLNKRSIGDLVLHGISSNRVWIFIGLLMPFLDEIIKYGIKACQYIGINIEEILSIAEKPWWQVSLVIISVTLFVLLIVTLFSIAGAILSFYGFTLHKLEDKYIRRSGLLTKHEVTMRLARLQMVVRQQDWLDILLKRINLKFEQSNAHLQNMQPGASNNKIIVPSVTASECKKLIYDVYPNNQLETITYDGIHKHYLVKYIGYVFLPLFTLLSIFSFINDNPLVVPFLFALFCAASCLVTCRWLRWGIAHDANYIYIRKGMLGVNYYCFPRYKVQQTYFKQSYFLKRKGLANINLVTASGSQSIPFIGAALGYKIIDSALYTVESSGKSWM